MADDHSEAIVMFTSIIGDVEPNVAEHYLAACDWDINRAVETYLEHPPDTGAHHEFDRQPAGPGGGGGGPPDLAVHGSTLPTSRPFPAFRPPAPPAPPRGPDPEMYDLVDDEEEDDELQRALQASLGASGSDAAMADEEGDEELQTLMRQRRAAHEARRRREQQNTEMLAPSALPANNFPAFRPNPNRVPPGRSTSGPSARRRRSATPPRRAPAAPTPPSREPPSHPPAPPVPPVYNLDSDEDYEVPPRLAAAARGSDEHPLPDLPDGINIEEARMLEAAMLGVPYEGRMPSFDNRPQLPQSPTAVAARHLRAEQDEAYEESLRADRAKAAAEAALKREQEQAEERARVEAAEEARRVREAEETAAREAAQAESRLKRSLTLKAQRIPEEPAADDPEAVQLMVRMPDGGRTSRRYRRSDPLQAVFDHLDVQAQGEGLKPGEYNLVTQFPRKVFSEGTPETLAGAGLSARQEALFIELTGS